MPARRTKVSTRRAKAKATRQRMGAKKKVTKKGAYNPARKKQALNSRRPFVEGKKRIASEISQIMTSNQTQPIGFYKQPLLHSPIVLNPVISGGGNAFQNIPITVFNRMNQGFNDFEMIGSSIFSRYLKLKVEVNFPIVRS